MISVAQPYVCSPYCFKPVYHSNILINSPNNIIKLRLYLQSQNFVEHAFQIIHCAVDVVELIQAE